MRYAESVDILREVDKYNNFLINCHASVDLDSICSALAVAQILKRRGKTVKIGSPDKIPQDYNFIPGVDEIEKLDFSKVNYSDFDVFFVLDSEDWQRINLKSYKGGAKVINIDHHPKNTINGVMNILDANSAATCEMLYIIFANWEEAIDKNIAELLLAGILTDTNFYQNSATTQLTFKITSELIEKGADYKYLAFNLLKKNNIDTLKVWGKLLERLEVDKENKFAWFALPYGEYKKFHPPAKPTSDAADMFIKTVEETNFGIAMIETDEKVLHISLRSREDWFDVSLIARDLGGGGHELASGADVVGLSFDDAVNKVLSAAKKFSKQTNEK